MVWRCSVTSLLAVTLVSELLILSRALVAARGISLSVTTPLCLPGPGASASLINLAATKRKLSGVGSVPLLSCEYRPRTRLGSKESFFFFFFQPGTIHLSTDVRFVLRLYAPFFPNYISALGITQQHSRIYGTRQNESIIISDDYMDMLRDRFHVFLYICFLKY